MTQQPLSVYDFGRLLLRTNDLDPVYVLVHNSAMDEDTRRRWLLAYWCFYHVGTACFISNGGGESSFWERMFTAAWSKEYPRCTERRHFRGDAALKSCTYLKQRGVADLFSHLDTEVTAEGVVKEVRSWVGFGPWIAFKVADMLERLGIRPLTFSLSTAMYEGSPTEGAQRLWEEEGKPLIGIPNSAVTSQAAISTWAVGRVLKELDSSVKAPPRYERSINVQEVETILCKWNSYRKGHYHVGEDIAACRQGLLRFAKCSLSQELLRAGKRGGLWS